MPKVKLSIRLVLQIGSRELKAYPRPSKACPHVARRLHSVRASVERRLDVSVAEFRELQFNGHAGLGFIDGESAVFRELSKDQYYSCVGQHQKELASSSASSRTGERPAIRQGCE